MTFVTLEGESGVDLKKHGHSISEGVRGSGERPRTPERQSPPGAALLGRTASKPSISNIKSRLWAALVEIGLAAGESTVPPSVGSIPQMLPPSVGRKHQLGK